MQRITIKKTLTGPKAKLYHWRGNGWKSVYPEWMPLDFIRERAIEHNRENHLPLGDWREEAIDDRELLKQAYKEIERLNKVIDTIAQKGHLTITEGEEEEYKYLVSFFSTEDIAEELQGREIKTYRIDEEAE